MQSVKEIALTQFRHFSSQTLDSLSLKWHQVKSSWLTPFMNNRWRPLSVKSRNKTIGSHLTKLKDCCEHHGSQHLNNQNSTFAWIMWRGVGGGGGCWLHRSPQCKLHGIVWRDIWEAPVNNCVLPPAVFPAASQLICWALRSASQMSDHFLLIYLTRASEIMLLA